MSENSKKTLHCNNPVKNLCDNYKMANGVYAQIKARLSGQTKSAKNTADSFSFSATKNYEEHSKNEISQEILKAADEVVKNSNGANGFHDPRLVSSGPEAYQIRL